MTSSPLMISYARVGFIKAAKNLLSSSNLSQASTIIPDTTQCWFIFRTMPSPSSVANHSGRKDSKKKSRKMPGPM